MRIGQLELEGYAALAPMAGVADRAMRELCIAHGAAFTVGELTSAKAVTLGDRKSAGLLAVSRTERPMGVQLFGSDPETMAQAARQAAMSSPDFIDINMGCPAPKVAGNGGGCALMRDPKLAARIVEAVSRAVSLPVTVKIRAGWDAGSVNAVEVAKHCEAAGAAAITVHGRTRAQMYAPPIDLSVIRQVKQAVSVPVIGNGDVDSPAAAARMYEQTGCDFIMVGRAAMGAPWIFSQIDAYLRDGSLRPAPPLPARMELLMEQARRMIAYKGERTAILQLRKHAAWYLKGLRGAAGLRRLCGGIGSMNDLERIVAVVLKQCEA